VRCAMTTIEQMLVAVPKGDKAYAELVRWLRLAAEDVAGLVPDPVWQVLDGTWQPVAEALRILIG
jgi:hypothetical protein